MSKKSNKSTYRIQAIINTINDMETISLYQIARILIDNNINFSENSNGMMFNLDNLNIKVVKKLEDFIEIYNSNKRADITRIKKINDAKKIVNMEP